MGNKIGRRRQVVDERYTRPQGLYQHKDVDEKKLRKLILHSKLAPCYPGDDERAVDLEECPICFLYYPSLNRSRCCMKGICTECFLQMKPPYSNRPTQCPFCKTSNYAVEYRGVRSKEEKGIEQLEEQRVLEAQIRMRHQEIQDEEERMQKVRDMTSSSRSINQAQNEYRNVSSDPLSVPSVEHFEHMEELNPSQESCAVPSRGMPSYSRQSRDANLDMELKNLMYMEAIWHSIQENGSQRNPYCSRGIFPESSSFSNEYHDSQVMSSPMGTPSIGSAAPCSVEALAEHQRIRSDSAYITGIGAPIYGLSTGNIATDDGRIAEAYPTQTWMEVAAPSGGMTSCDLEDAGFPGSNNGASAETGSGGNFLLGNYEHQMMLNMAGSVTDARTSPLGLTWLYVE